MIRQTSNQPVANQCLLGHRLAADASEWLAGGPGEWSGTAASVVFDAHGRAVRLAPARAAWVPPAAAPQQRCADHARAGVVGVCTQRYLRTLRAVQLCRCKITSLLFLV